MNKIFVSEPFVTGKEYPIIKKTISEGKISSVADVLSKFENEIKKITQSKFVISCSSGTSALHLALKSLNVKEGDEVIVPSLTFIATINAIKYINANPIFFGCDEYFNLDPKTLEIYLKTNCYKNKGVTYNKKTKKKISALIVVHVWGNSAKIKEIVKICKKFKIKVIEDATEALGSFYKFNNKKQDHLGTYGDVGCLSFNGNKIITTGNGGAILTSSAKINNLCRYYSTQATDNNESYFHNDIGFNYRLSALNAAFGIGQLKQISFFLKKKRIIHESYKKYLQNNKHFKILDNPEYSISNNWLNILKFKKNKLSAIINLFRKNDIQIKRVWHPNHLQKKFKKYETFKVSSVKNLVDSSICLPSSVSITDKKIKYICKLLERI